MSALAWAVANLAVTGGGGTLFVVAGGSMEPAVPRGSFVVVHPLEEPPAIGDAVTVRGESGMYVTHRVTRVAQLRGEPYVELKGDANPAPDPVLAPVSSVVGRVDAVVPVAGRLQLARARPAGWLVLLGAMLTLWMASGLLRPPMSAEHGTARRATRPRSGLERWPT